MLAAGFRRGLPGAARRSSNLALRDSPPQRRYLGRARVKQSPALTAVKASQKRPPPLCPRTPFVEGGPGGGHKTRWHGRVEDGPAGATHAGKVQKVHVPLAARKRTPGSVSTGSPGLEVSSGQPRGGELRGDTPAQRAHRMQTLTGA